MFFILVEWKLEHTCLPLEIFPVSSYAPGPGLPFAASLKRRPVLKFEALELLWKRKKVVRISKEMLVGN